MLRGGVALLRKQHHEAVALCRHANSLSPSDSWALAYTGFVQIFADVPLDAVASLREAIRLSPMHPNWYLYNLALAQPLDRKRIGGTNRSSGVPFERTSRTLRLHEPRYDLGKLGDELGSRQVVAQLKDRFSQFSLRNVVLSQPYLDERKLSFVIDALRRAGLPD